MGDGVKGVFVFRKQDKIGVSDAELDRSTLLECFVATSDYEAIKDFDRPECFILGRAGVGKTALLTKLESEKDGIIVIQPEGLALNFISNSNIIGAVTEMGADLNVFFRLLWRHVLCVEVLKRHFGILSETDTNNFINDLMQKFRRQKPEHVKAIRYIEQWGPSFWKDTDGRVKELTTKMETDLRGSLEASKIPVSAKLEAGQKFSEEEKIEVVKRTKAVVNETQMKELSHIINMLDDAISDRQKKYYLIIDKLDEDWVDESLRYMLIKALIQTVKDLSKVDQVRPLIVLRLDLLERVYAATRSNGFQEEKFVDLNLPVSWTREELTNLINLRVDFLVKKRYEKKKVTYKDIMPSTVNNQPVMDYLLDRTLMRPRDIIQFFNACIKEALEQPKITEEMIFEAEGEYSRGRLKAVCDEWQTDYPHLKFWLPLFKRTDKQFLVGELSEDQLKDMAFKYATTYTERTKMGVVDRVFVLAQDVFDNNLTIEDFRVELVNTFYRVGILGICLSENRPTWSYEQRKHITTDDIDQDTIVSLHPMFWAALGTG